MDFEETLGGSLCNTEYPVSFCKVPAGDFLDAGVSVVRENNLIRRGMMRSGYFFCKEKDFRLRNALCEAM